MKNLNKNIYALFTKKKLNNFSICELKHAYMAEFQDDKTEGEARKLIYREVYKLVDHGYLVKKGKSNSRNIRYYQTEVFKNKFLFNEFQSDENDFKLVLRGKLNKYKDNLVACIAEIEEYQRCCNEYPQLINDLKPKLDLGKHRSSQFLGKITAIENILNSHHP